MGEHFKVKLTNPERAEAFRKIVGSDEVFVESPAPEIANLPGLGERRAFKLDLDMYTEDEKTVLAHHIAQKFQLDVEYVEECLESFGVPILADDCTVIIKNPQRWVS